MVLAKADGIGCVWRCECGAIKVQCNFVTLHLDKEFYLKFSTMLNEASSSITKEQFNRLLPRDIFPGENRPGIDEN